MSETMTIVDEGLVLSRELDWLALVLDTRFKLHFGQPDHYHAITEVPVPSLDDAQGRYADCVRGLGLGTDERLLLSLALSPHLRPDLLDPLLVPNTTLNRPFSCFGGVPTGGSQPFFPTAETALWLLSGSDLSRRLAVQGLLSAEHVLGRQGLLRVEAQPGLGSLTSGALLVGEQWLQAFCLGEVAGPGYSSEFPAERVQTEMERGDIVLSPQTWSAVEEILEWLEFRSAFEALPGMKKRVRPGYRALFYGPPGTGKTMVASWLGKRTGKPVYRIDLSMIVSKYIGETEKNLANVFRRASANDWILFFDEADALFGRRTSVSSSNDRHANQEVSFLLQRVESYEGLVILASNFKDNMDEAFTRRFDLMAHFGLPTPTQRMELWRGAFSPELPLDSSVDLFGLSKRHDFAGGNITNVARVATMRALKLGSKVVTEELLVEGVRKELNKMGISRIEN